MFRQMHTNISGRKFGISFLIPTHPNPLPLEGERGQLQARNKIAYVSIERLFRLFLLAFLICFCIFGNRAFSDTLGVDRKNQTDELTRIKKELDDKRNSMETLKEKEKSTFEELLDLEERLDLAQRLKRKMALEEKNIEEELKIEEKSLEETNSKLGSYLVQSQRRLREIYKHGRFSPYPIIFEASSPVDFVNRLNLTKMILQEDENLLRETKNLKAKLEEKKQNLRKTKGELSELMERKAEEEKVCQEERKEKERLLKRIKSEKKLYAQVIEELEKEASELENILEQIHQSYGSKFGQKPNAQSEIQTKEDGLFSISKGKLPWPIRGKVIASFGEQRSSQFNIKTKNPGIEIEAEQGDEVLAVADGKVTYISRLRGYGNLVILGHDGGYYTLYAHLSEILVSPGEEVERIQRIGVIGESGLFSRPCLHFEIRKGKQPQNPMEWLR
jgi:septal ring factor EnvC (AmiA/AmiB activator)